MAVNRLEGTAEPIGDVQRAHLSSNPSSVPGRILRDKGSGSEIVTMMQPAQSREGNNPARCAGVRLFRASSRCFLRQSKMRPVLVEVTCVFGHEAMQVAFVQDNHMIEKIAAAATDKSLGDAVLPRALERRAFGRNAEHLNGLHHFIAEDRVAVVNQIPGRGIVRERVAQLLRYPSACRMSRNGEMHQPPRSWETTKKQ